MSESLHDLSREALIEEARRLGLVRPEVFTRAELQDEIVKRRVSDPKQQRRARGLLGLARDLLASVVEKGLHLPEVAEKLRATSPPPVPPPREPMATVTLAEIYVAQGHVTRARKILDEVLAREPEHAAARALLDKLGPAKTDDVASDAEPASPAPARQEPAPQPTPPRPAPMLDEAPLPRSYGVEEVVALPIDPTTALVYWETRRAPAETVVELEVVDAAGVRSTRTLPLGSAFGQHVARGLPAGATVVARLGARHDVAAAPRASATLTTPVNVQSARVARDFSRVEERGVVPLRAAPSPRFALSLELAAATPAPAASRSSASLSAPSASPTKVGGSSEALAAPPGAPGGSSGLSAPAR